VAICVQCWIEQRGGGESISPHCRGWPSAARTRGAEAPIGRSGETTRFPTFGT